MKPPAATFHTHTHTKAVHNPKHTRWLSGSVHPLTHNRLVSLSPELQPLPPVITQPEAAFAAPPPLSLINEHHRRYRQDRSTSKAPSKPKPSGRTFTWEEGFDTAFATTTAAADGDGDTAAVAAAAADAAASADADAVAAADAAAADAAAAAWISV